MKRIGCAMAWLGLALVCGTGAEAERRPEERGGFTLFKFAKAIGEETYTLRGAGTDRLELRDSFRFRDRGTTVPLRTTLLADGALRPLLLATDGSTSRTSELHDTLERVGDGVAAGTEDRVRVTRDGVTREVPAAAKVFFIDGYAPVAMQEMLLRFWKAQGRPASMAILPAGTVTIRAIGSLVVRTRGGAAETVYGYTVNGLIWGQESLWMNSAGQLAGLVSTDAELDHFEAVRTGYEEALPVFLQSAATATLAGMEEATGGPVRTGERRLAVVGATLIDGAGGEPVRDSVVLVEGERIVAAGSRRSVRVPRGVPVLDATGKWLLPGLWDMHAHFEQVEWGPVYLASGVTTVRDCGNELAFLQTVRDALAAGRGVGPEILMAGLVDGSGPESLGEVVADTPEEARAAVARYKAAGALQVKLYSSIRPGLVPAIAAEAHRLGMTVTGHVPTGMTASEAVVAGMDQISHVSYAAMEFAGAKEGRGLPKALPLDFADARSRRLLAIFRAHGTVFDPTLALFELDYHSERVPVASFEPGVEMVAAPLRYGLTHGGVGAKEAPAATAWTGAMLATVRALHAAGLPIVAGTDQAVPGYSLHRELELYVAAGMTPMEAIQSATTVPARVMGLAGKVGEVQAGERADLLLLGADPLLDIRATRQVWRTVAAGVVYEPGPLWRSVGFAP